MYKIFFLKPTFKKSKNPLVIFGSPRHSNWPLLRWIAPVPPAMITCSRDQFQECRTLSKTKGDFLISDRCRECMEFFPPMEKSRFFWNRGRSVLSEPSFQSPPPRADSASCGKGQSRISRAAALPWPLSSGSCQTTSARSCRHGSVVPGGSRKKQEPNNVLESRKHPKAGDQKQNR